MSIKGRIRKLEAGRRNALEPPCEECGGRIVCEQIAEDGTITYLGGEPCEACGSQGYGGHIGRIIVDSRDSKDRPEKRGVTLVLSDAPDEDVYEWP